MHEVVDGQQVFMEARRIKTSDEIRLLTQAASRAAEQRVAAGLALLLVAIGVALLAAVLAATLALSRRRYRP